MCVLLTVSHPEWQVPGAVRHLQPDEREQRPIGWGGWLHGILAPSCSPDGKGFTTRETATSTSSGDEDYTMDCQCLWGVSWDERGPTRQTKPVRMRKTVHALVSMAVHVGCVVHVTKCVPPDKWKTKPLRMRKTVRALGAMAVLVSCDERSHFGRGGRLRGLPMVMIMWHVTKQELHKSCTRLRGLSLVIMWHMWQNKSCTRLRGLSLVIIMWRDKTRAALDTPVRTKRSTAWTTYSYNNVACNKKELHQTHHFDEDGSTGTAGECLYSTVPCDQKTTTKRSTGRVTTDSRPVKRMTIHTRTAQCHMWQKGPE